MKGDVVMVSTVWVNNGERYGATVGKGGDPDPRGTSIRKMFASGWDLVGALTFKERTGGRELGNHAVTLSTSEWEKLRWELRSRLNERRSGISEVPDGGCRPR